MTLDQFRRPRGRAVAALFVSLLLALGVLVAPTPAAVAADEGTLQGRVTDESNAGVAGVEVAVRYLSVSSTGQRQWREITYDRGRRPVTNASGQWLLTGVDPGSYRVEFVASGYAPLFYPDAADIESADDVVVGEDGGEFTLDAVLQDNATISGTVREENDDPVSDVEVNLLKLRVLNDGTRVWDPVLTTVTDDDGTWEMTPEAGTYRLEFLATGFRARYWPGAFDVEDGSNIVLAKGDQRTFDVYLSGRAGLLQGVVTNASGDPVSGVVRVYQERTFNLSGVPTTSWVNVDDLIVDSEGSYRGLVEVGDYRLAFFDGRSAPLFHPSGTGLDEGADVTIAQAATVTRNFSLPATGQVRGLVTLGGLQEPGVQVTGYVRYIDDIRNGIPHFGTTFVAPLQGNNMVTTDQFGAYRVNVRPGDYVLRFDTDRPGTNYTKYYRDGEVLADGEAVSVASGDVVDLVDVEMLPSGVADDTVLNLLRPTMSGTNRVGQQLTVDRGVWVPNAATLSVQWLRDGVAIPGATALTYTTTDDDAGEPISVRVTGSFPGLETTSATSAASTTLDCGLLGLGCLGGATAPASPTNSAPPTITGTPRVGQVLTAVEGTWAPTGATYLYQWFADGAIVYGANDKTFAPRVREAGKNITVKVYATVSGMTGSATSAATADVAGAEIINVAPPVISGRAQVGEVLTAAGDQWQPGEVTVSYQWFAGEAAIPGATGRSLTLTQDQIGDDIVVVATARRTGYEPSTAASSVVGPVTAVPEVVDPLQNTSAPTVSGSPRVGQTLTAGNGTWTPTPDSYAYQWLADGVTIPGATARTFTPGADQVGEALSVRVTARLAGTDPASADSAATAAVGKALANLTVRAVSKKAAKKAKTGKVVVRIRVTADQITAVAGSVRVRVKPKRFVTVDVVNGLARTVVTGVRKGQRSLVVRYLGEPRVARAGLTRTVRVR